jgi:peptidoglycan/LPS O-acetylase OafA/YrhL
MNKNIDKLTVLRGFFAISVFIRHLWISDLIKISFFGLNLSFLLEPHGNIFVRLFFLLSGYLIAKRFYEKAYTLDSKGIILFFKHRVNRIFPLYYFLVFLFLLFIYAHLLQSKQGLYVLLRVLTFTYSTDLSPSFTGAFWSLSTEIQFYIICPFVFLIIDKFKKFRSKLGVLLLFGILDFIFGIFLSRLGSKIPEYPKSFIYYFIIFLFGIFLQILFTKIPKIRITYKNSNILFTILCIVLYTYTSYTHYTLVSCGMENSYIRWVYPTITCLIGGFLIYIAELYPAQVKNINWKILSSKPAHLFEIMGILSYGFYLWHGEIVYLLRGYFVGDSSPQIILFSISSFALSVLLSIATYYLIERKVKIFR